MKIISLEISNILSIEQAKIEFNDSGLVLVEGWNHDAGRGNGAGKTSIFNALTFALYDKLPRKVTATEIVRRGAKTGSARVVVRCGADEWVVTRSRPKNVLFEKNGVVQDITQEEWISKIRLTYEQFIVSMYGAQGSNARFLLLNDADKKSFLLQLLNLDEFSECKKSADEVVKTLTVKVEADTSKLNILDSKIDAYSESLVDEAPFKAEIGTLQAEVTDLNAKIISLQSVSKPDLSKYEKLEQDIAQKISAINEAKAKKSILHDQYRKLNSKIKPFSGTSECFACGTALDTSAAQKAHETEIEQLKTEALAIKQQIDACDVVVAKEASVSEIQKKLRAKKSEESSDYQAALDAIKDARSLVATKVASVKNLTLKLEENLELQNKIKVLAESRDPINGALANNKRNIELYKTIATLYSPTGAQAYILDSVVESFNDSVAEYVGLLWPNASYTLNSYRENAKGDVTAKFSESLTMDGKEVSVGSLSGGELKALSLCADFAILDILEKHFGLPLNPVILDEPFDGLDAIGRELVIDLLEKLAQSRQIFVVDHASEAKAMFSKIIRVEKRGGISTVSIDM